jgi:hypothetical protein
MTGGKSSISKSTLKLAMTVACFDLVHLSVYTAFSFQVLENGAREQLCRVGS